MPINVTTNSEINLSFSLSGSINIGGNNNPATTEVDPTVPSAVKAITPADISNWNAKLSAETDPTVPSAVKAITPADINNWNAKTSILFILKNTDQVTSSNIMSDADDMRFPVTANGKYIFKMWGRVGTTNSSGYRLAMTSPAGGTLEAQVIGSSGSSGNALAYIAKTSASESSTYGTSTIQNYYPFLFIGSYQGGGTAGYVQLQFRSMTSGANITMFAGAVIEVVEVV